MNMIDFLFHHFGVFVSIAYPFYASFKCLETKSSEFTAQWLTYWMVLSLIYLLEDVLGWLFVWLQIYYLIKFAFVLWLQLPQTKGAIMIYWRIIQPLLKKHESKIETVFAESHRQASHFKDWVSYTPSSMVNRSSNAADKILQELEEGDLGEKGE